MIELQVATKEDIKSTIELHSRYQIDGIKEEDKADGFVTTAFSQEELSSLIEQEQGLFIAKDGDKVVAYVMAASWEYWSAWPMFEYMINHLDECEFAGQKLSVENSYQYGPICIDKAYRGSGLLEDIFHFALEEMSKRYSILVTFVNKQNPRSYEAHTRKLGLEIATEFEYNSKNYYELCCSTSKPRK
jgi:hypothetical protein